MSGTVRLIPLYAFLAWKEVTFLSLLLSVVTSCRLIYRIHLAHSTGAHTRNGVAVEDDER